MIESKLKRLEGTTTVGVVCSDGVVLATDSRATAGYLVASKMARKIYRITDRIAFTTAGGVADTEKLVEWLRAESNYYSMNVGKPMSVLACARLLANIMNAYSAYYPFIANILVGGVDGSGPQLYFLDIDGGMTRETMAATGSGSPVAYGVLENEVREGMRVSELLPVAVRAVRTAMKRDVATGNSVIAATITEKDGYREFRPEEISKLLA
jgi:proteasome beta subunit